MLAGRSAKVAHNSQIYESFVVFFVFICIIASFYCTYCVVFVVLLHCFGSRRTFCIVGENTISKTFCILNISFHNFNLYSSFFKFKLTNGPCSLMYEYL
jgi:hypothetical protein